MTLFHMHKQLWMYRVLLCVHMMRPERLKLVSCALKICERIWEKGPLRIEAREREDRGGEGGGGERGWGKGERWERGWSYTLRTQSLLYWCTYFHGQSRHLVPGCFGHGTCSQSPSQWQLWVKGRHAHSNFLPGWILKGHAYVSSRSSVHALWTPYGFCWACGRLWLMRSVQFQQ